MKACRLCLLKEDLVNMKEEYQEDRSLYSIYLEFCGLEIPDKQTSLICIQCKEFLTAFRTLKRQALTNCTYFTNQIIKIEKVSKIDNEENENDYLEAVEEEYLEQSEPNNLPICEVTLTKEEYEYPEDKPEQTLEQTSKVAVKKYKKTASKKSTNGKHWCQYCHLVFPSKPAFVKHRNQELLENGGMVCDICGFKQIKRQRFMGHMRRVHLVDRSIRYPCDLCDKTFTQKGKKLTTLNSFTALHSKFFLGQILGHKRIEHFNERYICEICSRPLKGKKRLMMHIKHFHEKQRPCICPECGKGFSTKSQVRVHRVQVHSDEKPYPCSFCGKRFGSASCRHIHEKTHSSDLIQCQECDYKTNTIFNLNRHMIRHRDVYKYTCTICGQQFKCSTSLNLHKYTHQDNCFECEYCHKKFSRPQGLKLHIDSIHLQKKHICPYCNQAFTAQTCVTKHIQVQHEGLRYFCQCGKYFDRKTRYTKHGEDCELAATNEPEMKSIFPDDVKVVRPKNQVGRPRQYC